MSKAREEIAEARRKLLLESTKGKTVTKKKRKPVKSIEKLSDDLKGTRALKAQGQTIPVTTSSIDRWVSKAEQLEGAVDALCKRLVALDPELDDSTKLMTLLKKGEA